MREEYLRWCKEAPHSPYADKEVLMALSQMKENEEEIEDAFYRTLAFGTGGLRGVLGAGDNRMNVYTVAKATQGLADYVNNTVQKSRKSIAISYDSRIKSELFARVTASVLAANGIRAHIYPHLAPTPALSFAVRALGAEAGVMITASHNPSHYNGYKVYGSDGCQITDAAAKCILSHIEKTDIFHGVRYLPFSEGLKSGDIRYIDASVEEAYLSSVLEQSLAEGASSDKSIPIVYTPLNGTGLTFVLRALARAGFTSVTTVKEQTEPNGDFPTCPYPNPEIKEALTLGLRDARARGAEILLATDPDCDRVGVAVRNEKGEYEVLSGNEVGVLLLDYICRRREALEKMPKCPTCIKTVVTTDIAEHVALSYGVHVENVLTGFKYIGEKIGEMEKRGEKENFLFGFEESCGYLAGSYVRDKDGVLGALLVCEMTAYYRAQGESLTERLDALYAKHGYAKNTLYSYELPGKEGAEKIRQIMERIRKETECIGSLRVVSVKDYLCGIDGLPPANAVKLFLEGRSTVTVRPSGTEPKAKLYLSVIAQTKEEAEKREGQIKNEMARIFC